jgi:hypothetical protein
MSSALRVLPLLGAGSLLLTHLLTAAVFRRRTDAVIARLEDASVVELSTPPVPAIIHSCARRSVCANPVPNTVWLSQRGEIRANTGGHWRPFTAEQVISIHEPGFAWLAQMQGAPLSSAGVLDCYVDGQGLPEARLFGLVARGACSGATGRQGRIDALSRRTRMGAARHAV